MINLHETRLNAYRGDYRQFELTSERRRHEIAREEDRRARRAGVGVGRQRAAKAVTFEFPTAPDFPPEGSPLVRVVDVGFTYPGRDDFRLVNVDLGVYANDRAAVVGSNCQGKSTFVRLIAGGLQPTSGTLERYPKLRIGYYAQHFVDAIGSIDDTPVQHLVNAYGVKPGETCRKILGEFGLRGREHLTPIRLLSGGQKARVVLAGISTKRPHILLLDEPSNHLDEQSIHAMCDALDAFVGAVIVVSHDARLLRRLCADGAVWVGGRGRQSRQVPG